jgi:hypothetical protein
MNENQSESDLFHLAIKTGNIRYVHSVIFKRESALKNEEAMLGHLKLTMFQDVREKARANLCSTFVTNYWRENRAIAAAILSGSTGIDPELTGITEEVRLALVDKNQRLHFAVAVGFVRVALKAAELIGGYTSLIGRISEHAYAHLARPEFADLVDFAKFEIYEFANGGFKNDADQKISAARSGDYSMFWQDANETLGCWPTVRPVPIDPSLLD